MPRNRKLPDGMLERNGAYFCDCYAGSERVRKRLSTDFEAARQILNELKARANRADFGLLDNDYALKGLREEYLCHCKQTLKPATVNRYSNCLDNIIPHLTATRVAQVNADAIRRYRDKRLGEQASPRTINMEVTVFGTMLRWAVHEGKIGSNPIPDLKHLRHDHAEEGRPLTDDEVKRLLDSSPQPYRDIWYAYLITGMRKNELASLTFRDIDWDNRDLIVRSGIAKNHRERRIPIENSLWDILKKQEAGRKDRKPGKGPTEKITAQIAAHFSRDHVINAGTPLTHRSNLYHALLRQCAAAGIETETCDGEGRVVEHVDVHSLRRTFATNLISSGADPKSVQELLGHRTLDMTRKIYAKIHAQTKRQALGKLTYGQGTLAPDHIVEYPAESGNAVQNGHQPVTDTEKRKTS